eukprot:CAMPEP_0198294930 /NCGR_PEP_ID=MMETSP1449-20131203/24768_1 /TAXON_ID=420275 /ORGANISM="Attheya septentrionalis, Strain CCMP2084" /LENGTH=488 /DNA_ID=CAMNT_0043995031 /DNA_START=114 /DNA_END=1580 /DNA_ORIENTATION=+
MGTYLSTPVLEKEEESGQDLECPETPLTWGVVDMQGWRKSMEDSHIARTDVAPPSKLEASLKPASTKVFAVFDGHGGPEVARYCQLYLVDVLTSQAQWHTTTNIESGTLLPVDVGSALVSAFHAMDTLIHDPEQYTALAKLKTEKPKHGENRTLPEIFKIPTAVTEEEEEVFSDAVEEDEGGAVPATVETDNDDVASDKSDDSDEAVGIEEAIADHDDNADSVAMNTTENNDVNENAPGSESLAPVTPASEEPPESPFRASRIQNGRFVCNLPDHPIHAGCTSVVAVIIGRTLTVANAGDSRAVLCRAGGSTTALSYDHKPHDEIEMSRIRNAGGFVNQFGRVNGNLNLSRSIGDLKYKQVPGIPPSGQMITAEPDIIQVILNPGDEFIILGCDGIWDCLTNEEAVKYVCDRIDTKTPTEIGVEMLDDIVSEDPRASQGIGGDNMTIMIIDLLPGTRSYRTQQSSTAATSSSSGEATPNTDKSTHVQE